MKRTLTALTIAATMFASSASAFDPDDLRKLKDTGKCVECDLSDLSEANLSAADLWVTDLSGADLSGAKLLGTTMKGAILCNTTISDGSVIYSGC